MVVSEQNLNWEDIEKQFLDMGRNLAYLPLTLPEKVIDDLKNDLGMT